MAHPGRASTDAVLIAVVLLTVPLVGCAGEEGSPSFTGDPMTAQTGLDAADAEAQAWAEDPSLVSVTTFEAGPDGDPDQKPQTDIEWDLMNPPGDGLGHAWRYTYIDPDEDRLEVFVNGDGEIQAKDIVRSGSREPIGEWGLSSAEAAEIARENEEFSTIVEADDVQVITSLGPGSGEPVWWFNARSDTQDESIAVAVNTVTGESWSR